MPPAKLELLDFIFYIPSIYLLAERLTILEATLTSTSALAAEAPAMAPVQTLTLVRGFCHDFSL